MFNCHSPSHYLLFVLFAVAFATLHAEQTTPHLASAIIGLGEPMDNLDLKPFSITVFPDGQNLPTGEGSVRDGLALYRNQCMMCHGESGIEGPAARLAGTDGWISLSDPLRVLRIRKYPILLISVGSLWPHATSIFDYIRRAMPHHAPKSLGNDEVYALTAYILHLNGLLEEHQHLDQNAIVDIIMPGRQRSVFAWPEQ